MALEDAVVLAAALRDAEAAGSDPSTAFATFESLRRSRVERIVADGARSSSSKTPGPVARRFQDAALRFVFRHVVTAKSQAWVYDYRASLAQTSVSSKG
jgi:2-polyprenyl-6-methoxyphenol hydroxylase-like FAD-dependent oxidoreductase